MFYQSLLSINLLNKLPKWKQIRNFSDHPNVFIKDFKKHHISINLFQRTILSVGSAASSIINPRRGDMIACLGETTGDRTLKIMLNKMEMSKEGTQILIEKPRINTSTIDLKQLAKFPQGTLGKTYFDFLDRNRVTPDSRDHVKFLDNPELAYVIQRYREVHDLIHTALQMPTNMLGEVTVKWVEAMQFALPMCIGGAIIGPIRLKPKHRRLFVDSYLPWAVKTGFEAEFLLNIYFEKRWEQPLDDFYKEVNICPLVDKS